MIHKTYFPIFILLISIFFGSIFAKDLPKPALMLANVYHEGIDLKNYWVSEKYDGVRALWNGKQLISRGGNIYHAPSWFIKNFPAQKLDGELWISRQAFEKVVSTVRDKQADDGAWKSVKYMVFDLPDSPLPFDSRLNKMKKFVPPLNIPWLQVVKQWKIRSHDKLMSQLKEFTQRGAEGLMLHKGSSFYEGKRSGDLLKVKPYLDAEAIVISHISGKGKYQGLLGALLVKMPSGLQFKIGTGFSDKERRNPPAIGRTITFQYRGFTKNGVPRFASYLRIRDPEIK